VRASDDGARHRANHLERDGGGDRHRRGVLQEPRLGRLAWIGTAADLDWRPHRPRKISKRGNRDLRVLFVQAAWVVLIRPRSWERYGLKPHSFVKAGLFEPDAIAVMSEALDDTGQPKVVLAFIAERIVAAAKQS
jgi:hypothetical protein